jgi:iron complex outermembrane receptor protein
MKPLKLTSAYLLASLWAVSFSQQAQAQALEEIIVTAQKREQSVQDVPTTVTALSSETLSTFDVYDIDRITKLTAGMLMNRSPGDSLNLTIRGLGSTGSGQSMEASVAPYMDGVFGGGNQREFNIAFYDLERIEVFKGTQSGIIGKNTSLGAINIITRKPGREVGGYGRAGYEIEEGSWMFEGAVDLPASDNFAVRLAGRYEDTDGFMNNLATGNKIPQIEHGSVRINAVWDVTSDVDANLFVQYDNREVTGETENPYTDPGGIFSSLNPLFTPGKDKNVVKSSARGRDGEAFIDTESVRGSLTLNAKVGEHTLTSVSAGSWNSNQLFVDLDFFTQTAAGQEGIVLNQDGDYWAISEEVRVTSPQEGRFRYLGGLYYLHTVWDRPIVQFFLDVAPLTPLFASNAPFLHETDTFSVFGEVEYDLTDRLLIGGTIRYTKEDKDADIEQISNWPVNFRAFPRTMINLSPDFLDGSARIQFRLSDDAMLYASYSHGSKSGSVLDIASAPAVLKDEIAQTYEIGAKLDLLNGAAQLNLSAYYLDVEDFQDTRVLGGVFFAENHQVEGHGFEFQGAWAMTSEFTINGNLAYTYTDDKFIGGTANRAPKWTGNVHAQYEAPLADTGFTWSLSGLIWYHSSYFNSNAAEFNKTPSTAQGDITIALDHRDGWGMRVIARNVTDEVDCSHQSGPGGFPPNIPACIFIPTRTVMLEANYHF